MAKPVKPEPVPILVGRVGLCPHDDQAQHDYPTLCQLLMPRYDADRQLTREAGSFRLFLEGSMFVVRFECPTEQVMTLMSTTTLGDLLLQLEDHLSSTTAVWTATWTAKQRSRRALDKAQDALYNPE
jgi:hypothetical protein